MTSNIIYENYLYRELLIDRREKSKNLAWSSIVLAFENSKRISEEVRKPKALGDIRGVSLAIWLDRSARSNREEYGKAETRTEELQRSFYRINKT